MAAFAKLLPYQRVVGRLDGIEQVEDHIAALIEGIGYILPSEMETALRKLVGKAVILARVPEYIINEVGV
jgi:hypothetical protein